MLSKVHPFIRSPFESIRISAPVDPIYLDCWSADDEKHPSVYVVVMTDNFIRLAQAFSCQIRKKQVVTKQEIKGSCLLCVGVR